MTGLGAFVIAFDVMFSEPDRPSPEAVADSFRSLDEATSDQVYADAIRTSRVVLD